ncbi:MAG: helix-turn-helix domain-containing protein [Saprospiraceae bacterium]|nr:helix-turn-helix domain-containing protein [Saprospiraceae bacterium]
MKIIGNNLKAIRQQLGFSQESIAEYLGIPREMISYFENNQRDISIEQIEKLANLFGVDEEYFLEDNNSIIESDLAFAFRSNSSMSSDSLKKVALFKKIVKNYVLMQSKL